MLCKCPCSLTSDRRYARRSEVVDGLFYHDYSAICHVSAIKKDSHFSWCNLAGCHGCKFVIISDADLLYVLIVLFFCFATRLSPNLSDSCSLELETYKGILQVSFAQIFVLAPYLILSVRGCYAKRVANSDTVPAMITIIFQE
ncbi:uncharacterized protein HD556DRAFT_1305133 [Suillus plorans]|uniref:Uncharacterized protein n=1 Tax=Suillus plorans TaxID=116603 RepID=A0A9P7J348_9AGAM|nr:uncharacterized protein HD556DRAFT_1305133 [Suillus plorans]KAG1800364.1 hypothetical protein HD556DRAFT_1305133 [Suillus plorans]